jgi:hypothetical protein
MLQARDRLQYAEVMTMLLLLFFAYQQEPTKRWQCRPLKELPIRTMSHAEGVYTQPRGNFAEIVPGA